MLRRSFLAMAACLVLPMGALAQEAEDILVLEIGGQTSGTIEIQLATNLAPNHAARLKELARSGAYDNVVFHRVIDGFMAQTGDVQFGTRDTFADNMAGRGGSDLPDLAAEFSAQPYVEGIVGMARAQDPNSANSQFFIMFQEYPSLNGQYTVVGRVLSGMDVVHSIKRGEGPNGMVIGEPDYIASARVKADIQ